MPRPRALTPEQDEQAAMLYLEGSSRRQIAAAYAVSDMAVRNALARKGIRMRSRTQALNTTRNPARFQHRRASSVWDLARVVNRRVMSAKRPSCHDSEFC